MPRTRDDAQPDEVVVGLIADPDLPASLAGWLHETLPGRLRRAVDDSVSWNIQVVQDPFEEMYQDYGQLMAKAQDYAENTIWDLAVSITDQPVRDHGRVFVASVDPDSRVAMVSLPALGGTFLRHRLRRVVVPIITLLATRSADPRDHSSGHSTGAELRRRLPARGTRVIGPEQGTAGMQVVRTGWLSTARLLSGMVRANRPWRLLLGLSRALAGAVAGVAFGLLYSSTWQLATSLGPLRLAGLTVAAVAAMTAWTVVGHRLWEAKQPAGGNRHLHIPLRNASTLITVAAGSIAFLLAMLAIALCAAALVIPPAYLASTLGRPVSVADYLTIAAMATVLGTLAGAVGSGLEDEAAVRQATYGYREQQRSLQVEREASDGSSPIHQFRRR